MSKDTLKRVAELLALAAWPHTQATVSWLSLASASLDLREQAVMLAGKPGEPPVRLASRADRRCSTPLRYRMGT